MPHQSGCLGHSLLAPPRYPLNTHGLARVNFSAATCHDRNVLSLHLPNLWRQLCLDEADHSTDHVR